MVSPATRVHGLLWIDTARVAGPVYETLRAIGRTKLPPPASFIDMSLLDDARRLG